MARSLFAFGLSHRTTPLSVREQLAVPADQLPAQLAALKASAQLEEATLVSTCNRVELYATSQAPARSIQAVRAHLQGRADHRNLDEHAYVLEGSEAVRHLFEVASGLDSMVLGEPQILGQVKEAYAAASQHGSVGTVLGRCFERSFGVAKRVRTETELAVGNVSVSSIACDLAEKIFGTLDGRKVLLVGAGKMSEVAARSLGARGASLAVVNRNPEKAEQLAQACGGRPRPLEALATELADADVVISSTAKQGFMITHDLMQGVCRMRRWRQLFLIDIAVPRDVDPRVDALRNVFLYDMDDLQKVSRDNLLARERAVGDAQAIIGAELEQFEGWLASLELTPTIVALREHVQDVLQQELEKTLPKLQLQDKDRNALEAMAKRMTNQLLHAPLTELKQGQDEVEGAQMVSLVRRLFRLRTDGEASRQGASEGQDPALAPAGGRGPAKR